MARKGDGKQRHDNDVRMAGDHDNRRYPDGQARLPFRHRHRRDNRQPLLMAAHHFHRHAAEQGGSAMVRRRHIVEYPRDRHRRKPVLRRSGEQIHKRNKILARAHLQHGQHGVRVERQGRVYRHQRPVRAVHRHPVHRPATEDQLADHRAGSLSADAVQRLRIRHGLRHRKGMVLPCLPRRRQLYSPRACTKSVRDVVGVECCGSAHFAHRGRGDHPVGRRGP